MGIPVLSCGDVIREEARKRGLAPTASNLGELMFALRREEGPDVVARRLLPIIREYKDELIVIEGGRNLEEISAFKERYEVITVGIHSSPDVRYERLRLRGRRDDSAGRRAFDERDTSEIKVGMDKALAEVDIRIVNESSLEDFKKKVLGLLQGLLRR